MRTMQLSAELVMIMRRRLFGNKCGVQTTGTSISLLDLASFLTLNLKLKRSLPRFNSSFLASPLPRICSFVFPTHKFTSHVQEPKTLFYPPRSRSLLANYDFIYSAGVGVYASKVWTRFCTSIHARFVGMFLIPILFRSNS